jgi:copper chaperone
MTCAHCTAAITAEVGRVPGVEAVDVDLETKRVQVRGQELDEGTVVAAIDEAGYDAVAV